MLEDLLDEALARPRLVADSLGPEGAESRLVDLADVVVGRTVGPAPVHHQREALGLPAEPDELRLQALSLLVPADVDPAVADSGRALNALGLGCELLGGRIAGL